MDDTRIVSRCISMLSVAALAVIVVAGAGVGVSYAATLAQMGSPKIFLQSLSALGAGTGFGTTVTTSCPGGDTCYSLNGQAAGTPFGSGTFIANVNSVSPPDIANNGSGGTCTPASGTMTIKFGMTGSIIMGFVGTLCSVGGTPQAPNVGPVTLEGSFFVTGGQAGNPFGRLNGNSARGGGGSGTGRLTFSGDASGNVLLWLSGLLEFSSM